MRHRVSTKTLKRDSDHRRALLKNLSTSLVEHEKVVTTLTKAKYVKPHVEKLITKAKKGPSFNNVKFMKAKLSTNESVKKILEDLGKRFEKTPGGYTRIVKLPNRAGDNAPMARLELVKGPVKEKTETASKKSKKESSDK